MDSRPLPACCVQRLVAYGCRQTGPARSENGTGHLAGADKWATKAGAEPENMQLPIQERPLQLYEQSAQAMDGLEPVRVKNSAT